MKKTILLSLLFIAGLAKLSAQHRTYGWQLTAKADATFSMTELSINHRHKIWFGNGNIMAVELKEHNGYANLADLETLLAQAKQDLEFVNDTIATCPECNYRIDYLLNANNVKMYRVQKFQPKGTFLFEQNGTERKPFKSERDTFRILGMDKDGYRSYQITFLLKRFSEMESILSQKGKINSIIDTFSKVSAPKYKSDRRYPWANVSTILMHTNLRDTGIMEVLYSHSINRDGLDRLSFKSAFNVQANIGVGFVRDRLAPVVEGGFTYALPKNRSSPISTIIGLYVSGYFVFDRNADGKFVTRDNWFLNAEFGNEGESEFINALKTSRLTLGIGYLISQKGNYFTENTMKAFMNIRLRNGITVSPEIIVSDHFKSVFPGLTVKIF